MSSGATFVGRGQEQDRWRSVHAPAAQASRPGGWRRAAVVSSQARFNGQRVRSVVTDVTWICPRPRIHRRVDVSFTARQCATGSSLDRCCCSLPFFTPSPSSSSDAFCTPSNDQTRYFRSLSWTRPRPRPRPFSPISKTRRLTRCVHSTDLA